MFALPDLPYAYDALQPVLSELTLRTHHDKHHARYVTVTNELLAERAVRPERLEDVVRQASAAGDRKLADNAGQAWNHAFFWESMSATAGAPAGSLRAAIEARHGGVDLLRAMFLAEGAGHFGSGWVWLIAKNGEISVATTHDGATALELDGTPLLVCDLWEHAYYLDHRNDRAGFLAAWWDRLVDWDFVSRQFDAAQGQGAAWRYPGPTAAG